MLQRYFMRISYKGTNYSGWQIQPNAISVQEVIQINLSKLNRKKEVKIMGCGRTDAGVHAVNYFAHMDFPIIDDTEKFLFKLNHMLPHDIAIHGLRAMPEKAHTRFDAISREYKYYFHFDKDPFLEDRSVRLSDKINKDVMERGAKMLLNYSDFESFSRVNTDVKNFICKLSHAGWESNGNQLVFTIKANRFLRNMVRAIVGTLVYLGEGKITLTEFEAIINAKDRTKAGKSAPAKGLILTEIAYPYEVP